MALPACPRCGNHDFEIQESRPLNAESNFLFVQCADCGTVVGVQDFYNLGSMLLEQRALLKQIAQSLGIKNDINDIGGLIAS